MTHGIHDSLISLAVDIVDLIPLEGNPRRGNVEAIMSSYLEFGQIKPIVVRPNSDGTSTVIAGNHQLEAAKRLGWDKIAAVSYDVDDVRAIAFALADNRTMELGYTEPELLNDMVIELSDYYPELIDGLGWDEFEIAELEQRQIREEHQVIDTSSSTYVPIAITSNDNGFTSFDKVDDDEPAQQRSSINQIDQNSISVTRDKNGNQQLSARSNVDHNDAVVRGSTVVAPGSAPQAVVQYTIVFDNTQQQAKWYDFIKWLKSDPAIVGVTTAERLIDFIEQHTEV